MTFTISDLKKHLGPGLGLRKNKYLIEIPVPGIEGASINMLCKSAGLPERNINTVSAWYRGRKYNMRAETDYIGSYEVSMLDDSEMRIRSMFDKWLKQVDNSAPKNNGIFGASYESGVGELLSNIKSGIKVANDIKNAIQNPSSIVDFFLGFVDGSAGTLAPYQTDINIWQLSGTGTKVYGYKLQNAFPQQLGIVTLDDGEENTMSEFSVTFAFSEFIPLESKNLTQKVFDAIIGDDVNEILDGVESLFD